MATIRNPCEFKAGSLSLLSDMSARVLTFIAHVAALYYVDIDGLADGTFLFTDNNR